MSDWADVTSVRRRGESTSYDVDLHPGWAIVGKANGGYLLGVLARAAGESSGTPHPLAVSAHYLRAPDAGPAVVRTEVIRSGRRVSTTRSTLWQNEKPCIEALISSGELHSSEPEWSAAPPPPMPPPEACITPENEVFRPEIFDHAELLLDPVTAPLPTPSGDPRLRFWFRLRDGSPPDVLALLLAVDVGPPTMFNLGKVAWAPTVELSVLLRGVPAPGWLLCESRTLLLADGWFDEECLVWDSTGRLVAQSRQLALVL